MKKIKIRVNDALRARILFSTIFLTLSSLSTTSPASPVDDVIFKGDKFSSPISVNLPDDLSYAQEADYIGKIEKSGGSSLPPLPPYQGLYSQLQPELKGVLCALEMIQLVEIPGLGGRGRTKHFRYTDKAPKDKTIILATRSVDSIEYENCYKIDPMGMGKRDVCAKTFTYSLRPAQKGVKLPSTLHHGEAVVIKDPNTGKWGIEKLKLNDPDRTALLNEMARSLTVGKNNSCNPVNNSSSSEKGKLARPSPAGPQSEWVGKWEGVEESWMEILQRPDGTFTIRVVGLEGEMTARGIPNGKVIEFYQLGAKKSIRFGNGEDTGLKWLADKKECLIIAEGEGYCRR